MRMIIRLDMSSTPLLGSRSSMRSVTVQLYAFPPIVAAPERAGAGSRLNSLAKAFAVKLALAVER